LKENNKSADNIQKILFENKFEAWIHGPVYYGVYDIYKIARSEYINFNDRMNFKPNFDKEVEKFLNRLFEKYESCSGDMLEIISHNNSAWIKARGKLGRWDISRQKIKDEDIWESQLFKEGGC
jgi:uncharacterized phage-associated protein